MDTHEVHSGIDAASNKEPQQLMVLASRTDQLSLFGQMFQAKEAGVRTQVGNELGELWILETADESQVEGLIVFYVRDQVTFGGSGLNKVRHVSKRNHIEAR
jgi:hypothetical protein